MNHYDDEENIIQLLQSIERSQICFANFSVGLSLFFNSIYREKLYRDWINSSGKNDVPPDFFSPNYRYMLEVMRVDDYVLAENSPNVLESKFVKNIENMLREKGVSSIKESNIELLVIPDMSKASENNYRTYVENYKRIVNKHLSKIDQYRRNHPGYKLGFLILDEAPAYIRVENPSIKRKAGELIQGYRHVLFRDKNFMEIFLNHDLDYIIWMTPYKNTEENPRVYPLVIVIDLKKYKKRKMQFIEYKDEEMQCLEVEK